MLAAVQSQMQDMQKMMAAMAQQNQALQAELIAMKSAPQSSVRNEFFATSEIASLQTDLAPADKDAWLTEFASRLKLFARPSFEILALSDEEWMVKQQYDPTSIQADSLTARALLACLKKDADHVKQFNNKYAGRPSIKDSGRALFIALSNFQPFEIGEEEIDYKAEFDKKIFFTAGAPSITNKLAASTLKNEFLLLPEGERAARNALLYKMLDKMLLAAPSLADAEKTYRRDIRKAETLGQPVYTFEQLASLVASELAKVPAASAIANASFSSNKCLGCGKLGHIARNCKEKCATCHNFFCPGRLPAKKCMVQSSEPIPAEVPNAIGIMPEKLRLRLVEAHEKYHAGEGLSTSAAEFGAVASCAVCWDAMPDAMMSDASDQAGDPFANGPRLQPH
jgi:hypothetical protein